MHKENLHVIVMRMILIMPVIWLTGCIIGDKAPVITILSENPIAIGLGSPYTDAGATALDGIPEIEIDPPGFFLSKEYWPGDH